MHISEGIPRIEDYEALTSSALFSEIEAFSDRFIHKNKDALRDYSRKWVVDPLHQWSRQWEYPFVYDRIAEYRSAQDGPMSVLDAGSGVTFFPFFVASRIANSEVSCCDNDSSFKQVFANINGVVQQRVSYHCRDIRSLAYGKEQFDIVYCISVLEHLEDCEGPISEFRRVLKPNGLLIVTFDISLTGQHGIAIARAQELLHSLDAVFPRDTQSPCFAIDRLASSPEIVTTRYFATRKRSLLPWNLPWQERLRLRLSPQVTVNHLCELTFICTVHRKS